MQVNDDDFQIIDSQYEITSSKSCSSGQEKPSRVYQASIRPTKAEVDLSIVENQYYQLEVKKKGLPYCCIERRFSEFQLIYEILSRNHPGYIFPAFPSNGLFAFMKSKLLLSKDLEFVARRTRTIERFFNKVINESLFDPENCKELKEFLSAGREFQARKQIQKSNKALFSIPWTKLKNYFASTRQNKYSDKQEQLQSIKGCLQALYNKCRFLIECLKEEFSENERFLLLSFSAQLLQEYRSLLLKHDGLQKQNLRRLEELQFQLFCQNEDLHMVDKIFDKIAQLKDNEDNYVELKAIEETLEQRLSAFITDKLSNKALNEDKLKALIEEIKKVGRIAK